MGIVIGIGVGVALGMYISSQVKCHISSSINNKELLKNINNFKKSMKEYEQKKRKN